MQRNRRNPRSYVAVVAVVGMRKGGEGTTSKRRSGDNTVTSQTGNDGVVCGVVGLFSTKRPSGRTGGMTRKNPTRRTWSATNVVVRVDDGPSLTDLPRHWPTPSPTTPLLATHGPVKYSTIDTTDRENDIIVMNSENDGNRLSTNDNYYHSEENCYYPIWSDVENGCVYGIPPAVYADFESDIGDDSTIQHYLFDRKSKCCEAWFNENESSYDECNANEFDMQSYAMEVRQDEIEEEEEEMNDDDDNNVSSKSKASKGSKDDDDDDEEEEEEEEEEEAEEVDDNEEGNESNNGGEEIIVTIAPTPTLSTIITTEIPTLESTGAEETGDTSSFFPTSSGGGGTAVMTEVPTVEGSEASTTTGTGGSSTMDGTTTTTSPTAATSGTASISGSNETPAPSPVVTSSNSSASGSPGVATDTTSTGSTSGPPVVVVTSTTAMPSPTVEGSIVSIFNCFFCVSLYPNISLEMKICVLHIIEFSNLVCCLLPH